MWIKIGGADPQVAGKSVINLHKFNSSTPSPGTDRAMKQKKKKIKNHGI